MCGISGFFHPQRDFTEDKEWCVKINDMKKSLRHRGPDEEDIYIAEHACIAHKDFQFVISEMVISQ